MKPNKTKELRWYDLKKISLLLGSRVKQVIPLSRFMKKSLNYFNQENKREKNTNLTLKFPKP